MLKYQTILFDLDGTLTDPKEGIINSIEYALHKFNIEVEERADLTVFIGPPLQESFQKYLGFNPEQAWQAIRYYREYFAEKRLFENKVYPGIRELLEKLQAEHVLLAIATSKPTIYTERILEHFQLKRFFHIVIGSNLDGTRVKKGDVIRAVLEKIPTTNTNSIVMVGDREHDIIGAKENLIEAIGVTYGYGSEEELKAAGARYIAHSVAQLQKMLL